MANPKSNTLASSRVGHHDVGRLDVAVHQIVCMCFTDGVAHLHAPQQAFLDGVSTAADARAQRGAEDALHGDPVGALRGTHFVDGGDVRMVQGCRGTCLAHQTRTRFLLLHVIR